MHPALKVLDYEPIGTHTHTHTPVDNSPVNSFQSVYVEVRRLQKKSSGREQLAEDPEPSLAVLRLRQEKEVPHHTFGAAA